MQLHNGNSATVKPLATDTADVAALLARVNGQTSADSTEPMLVFESRRTGNSTAKPRRATGPQMKGGKNLATKRGKTARLLIKALGITVADAVTRTNSNPHYVRALKLVEQSGDLALARAVDEGAIAPLPAAKSIKHLAAMKVAFAAASPAERITFFRSDTVKSFIIKAGLMTPEEHLKAAVDDLGVEGALNVLAAIDGTAVAAA